MNKRFDVHEKQVLLIIWLISIPKAILDYLSKEEVLICSCYPSIILFPTTVCENSTQRTAGENTVGQKTIKTSFSWVDIINESLKFTYAQCHFQHQNVRDDLLSYKTTQNVVYLYYRDIWWWRCVNLFLSLIFFVVYANEIKMPT